MGAAWNSTIAPKPDKLPVGIAKFEHLIGSPGCHDLGVDTGGAHS
jgi:hypothetical protein